MTVNMSPWVLLGYLVGMILLGVFATRGDRDAK
jgi:Na+/proline symporter